MLPQTLTTLSYLKKYLNLLFSFMSFAIQDDYLPDIWMCIYVKEREGETGRGWQKG